ncbi:MAG: Fe-S cluster assembly ATPase SufC [Candidatus Magasanikbacteria bacterium]|nr:Fe-S cluster assembly ATPase SufC [Candidatus Magasanikbacteria bacterium]
MPNLTIKNLHATVGNTKILNGVSLSVSSGEIHIIMGQNGSGKSTLLSVLMGSPKYTVTMGSAKLDKKNLLDLSPSERAQAGLFLAFQHPQVVAGVALGNFLRLAKNTIHSAQKNKKPAMAPAQFAGLMREEMNKLNIDPAFMSRSINDGFSGGEKKKSEVLQMAILEPAFAFLDEIDSGLDVDALKIVSKQISTIHKKQKMGLVIVSHNPRILDFIKPDKIHIMSKGKIVAQGGTEILKKIEKNGFESFIKKK